MSGFGSNDGWSYTFVHHREDFLADGREVLSHGPSSNLLVGGIGVASSDESEEDLEDVLGPLDPNEIAVDVVFFTEMFPQGPGRGLFLPGGCNHCTVLGFFCKAENSAERLAVLGWHSCQGWSWGKFELKKVRNLWSGMSARREALSAMALWSPGRKLHSEQ